MLYKDVCCGTMPEPVVVEALPEGSRRVVMSRDFAQVDDGDGGTAWQGQQADFVLDQGRDETAQDIAAAFDDWLAYAEDWRPAGSAPTMEQRMADAEAAILALMGF